MAVAQPTAQCQGLLLEAGRADAQLHLQDMHKLSTEPLTKPIQSADKAAGRQRTAKNIKNCAVKKLHAQMSS